MPTKQLHMEGPTTLQAKHMPTPQCTVALSLPFFYLCPQFRCHCKIVNLLHLTPHLSNPAFTSVVSDLSTTLFWLWQFSSPPSQNITYLALTLLSAQSQNVLQSLHLSSHLPLKLCTYPASSAAHSTDHPRKYSSCFLTLYLCLCCSKGWNALLFVPHIETLLLPQVPFTLENLPYFFITFLQVSKILLSVPLL